MYAKVSDVDKALQQVNSVFSLVTKRIEELEKQVAELEAAKPQRRTTAKKESDDE